MQLRFCVLLAEDGTSHLPELGRKASIQAAKG
jgi:hypothetical protein